MWSLYLFFNGWRKWYLQRVNDKSCPVLNNCQLVSPTVDIHSNSPDLNSIILLNRSPTISWLKRSMSSTSITIIFTEKYYMPSRVLSTLCASPTDWHLPLALAMCKVWAPEGVGASWCWLHHLLKRVQGGDQEWGTLKKTGRTGLQIVRYFQGKILWAQFSHFLISRKALKSFMTSNNLLQNICAGSHGLPLHKNHTCADFPLDSMELFLRVTWNAISQAIVFILPQIKHNSQLSYFAFIFSQKCINSFKPLDNLMRNILLELRYWASQVVLVVKNPTANEGANKRCRWAWQPTPVFLPGESHGQRSLAGYSLYGPKELDMTETT